jgi:hypothetical protein
VKANILPSSPNKKFLSQKPQTKEEDMTARKKYSTKETHIATNCTNVRKTMVNLT